MVSGDRREATETFDTADEPFDAWLKRTCSPPENYTFAQYGRYVEGWRLSKPWAYRSMSIAYDRWAETPSLERLRGAWKCGLALKAKAAFTSEPAWALRETAEYCADFWLAFEETLGGVSFLAAMNCDFVPGELRLDLAAAMAGFLADRVPALLDFEVSA